MTRRMGYHVRVRSDAPPDIVFDTLYEADGWRQWAPLVKVSGWEDPDVVGVGAVRRAGAPPMVARERVVEHEPGRAHGYVIDAERPARDYRARVTFTPDGTGTWIDWQGSFEPNPPVIGHAYGLFVRRFIDRLAHALAREAERRASSA